jgi:serine/threonine-protein kinase
MLPLNTHIGQYRLLEFLGMGGMGEVYRAVHTRSGRVVALKVLSRMDRDPKCVQRFLNEARIHAGLHHPNIATLYDFLECEGRPCMVMEYVDGRTLAEHLRGHGPLPLSEATFIFQRVVDAVSYVHDHGVAHRDIKSTNVKIGTRREVKLLDFGIAKDANTPALTREGNFVGTVQYLAPEQFTGATADDRSTDMWALGILLYEIVTGQLPFAAETVTDCLRQITLGRYPPPESLQPALLWEARVIIDRCLQKKPAQRYPTAQDLWKDTERLAAVVSTPRLTTAIQGRPSGLKVHKLIAMMRAQWPRWVAGGALMALITVGMFLAWQAIAPELSPKPAVSTSQQPPFPGQPTEEPRTRRGQEPSSVPVHIGTQPSGFDIYRGGQRVGTTPWHFDEPIGSYFKAVLKRQGFKDEEINFWVNDHENEYLYTPEKSSRR